MNVFELAERRYRELVPNDLVDATPTEQRQRLPVSQMEAWITNYVLPAIEEVSERPVFREYATWPQQSLVAEAETDERVAVNRVDTALIAEAKELKKLLHSKLVSRQLDDMYHDAVGGQRAARSADLVDEEQWSENLPTRYDLIPFYRSQIGLMATGAWTDLVCPEDYFGPSGGMLRKTPLPAGTTEGAMIVSLSPHLVHVGDMITQCLLQRVRSWTGSLAEARRVCYEAIQRVTPSYEDQVATENAAWLSLQKTTTELHRLCLVGPEARIRASCIALVQMHAEFHPDPELDWLGLSEHVVNQFRGQLRRNLTVERDLETLDRIAAAVVDLKLLYRGLDPSVPAHDEAIASGGLVLIEATRKAYWNGAEIESDWDRHKKPWELLWKLAEGTRMASPVGNFDLYDTGVPASTLANRWHRLKELIPGMLAKHVVPGHERATYRLNLPIRQIYLF